MTVDEATTVLEHMAMARDRNSREGEALRLIVREVTAQRAVGLRLEACLHDAIKTLEDIIQKPAQQDLFGTGA